MSSASKVSVVIPIYNAEKYIKRCIDSIISQTLADIEIICVNDGSTDGSLKTLLEFEKKDNRIKVINKKNEGANYARRDGFEKSSGEWIAFIDADDKIHSDYLETLMNVVEDGVDVVIGETVTGNKAVLNPEAKETPTLISDKEQIYKLFVMQWVPQKDGTFIIPISPWSKIIKRSLLEKNDWYVSNYSAGNDSLMTRQVFQNMTGSLAIIHKPLYFYFMESKGLGSGKGITTNTGEKITRLSYEMQRYDIDAAYAKKRRFNIDAAINVNRLFTLYNYLIIYINQKTVSYADLEYVEENTKKIKIDFDDDAIKEEIEVRGLNYDDLSMFYSTTLKKGAAVFMIDHFDEIIAHRESVIAHKDEIIAHRESVIAQKDEIIANNENTGIRNKIKTLTSKIKKK